MPNDDHAGKKHSPIKRSEPVDSEGELTELYAGREFSERPVRQSFDDWLGDEFVPDVILLDESEDRLPAPDTSVTEYFVTTGGLVGMRDEDGNCETYDPYLPENSFRALHDLVGTSALADLFDNEEGE